MFQLALILAATVALGVHGQTSNYSALACTGVQHTMVAYPGVGPTCNPKIISGVNVTEITTIINTHNALRSRIAKGLETRGMPGPQPPAADMMKLVWNNELAVIAQRWADQCTFAHDACRKVANSSVGQNLYMSMTTSNSSVTNWTAATTAWFEEVTLFDKSGVPSYLFSNVTGHYTQVVWANTSLVGCGFTKFKDTVNPTYTKSLYACNYARAGNYKGSPMYKVGTACSQCPAGKTCSSAAEGLCI